MKKTNSKKTAAKKVNAKKPAPVKQPEVKKTPVVVQKEATQKAPVVVERAPKSSSVIDSKKTNGSKPASFLQTVLYLFALLALFAVGLFVYLAQTSTASLESNYHFVSKRLTKCYEQKHKDSAEIERLKEEIDYLKNNKKGKKVEPKCPEPQDRHEILNPEEYAPYEKGGSAVIEGDLCFTLEDGVKKCFDRAQVFINPVTSYSDEWYHRGWAGREALKAPDEVAVKMNKMTLSDKDGKFKFEGLAAGSYYVGAVVCVPKKSTDKACVLSRYAAKVSMKNRVKPKLKKVYP